MSPVIGLVISEGQSEGQAFLNKGQPYGRSFRFLHTLDGFKVLLSMVNEVRSKTGSSPVVILESTGHYHQAVVQFLESQEILSVLKEFPTSKAALQAGLRTLTDRIGCLCPRRSEKWADEKAKAILDAATNNPFQETAYASHLIELYINLLFQYQEHLSHLEHKIDALAKEIEEYIIIQSIPGVVSKIAATVLSEIGKLTGLITPRS